MVEMWIAYADQNYIIAVGKNLFKSQKNETTTG